MTQGSFLVLLDLLTGHEPRERTAEHRLGSTASISNEPRRCSAVRFMGSRFAVTLGFEPESLWDSGGKPRRAELDWLEGHACSVQSGLARFKTLARMGVVPVCAKRLECCVFTAAFARAIGQRTEENSPFLESGAKATALQTLARLPGMSSFAKRLGVRWPSAAFPRRHVRISTAGSSWSSSRKMEF